MEEFLAYYKIDHKVRKKEEDGFSWQIIPCPFNAEHNIGEVGVSTNKHGYGFKCFHESCQNNHWQEFKSHLETVSGEKFFFKTNLKDAVQADSKPTSKMVLKRASTITPEVLTWLWPNRIPFGKLTLFAGHPGIGKGMATMYVAACASTGKGWVDCENTNAPVESIIISSEDSSGDTLVPRLMAAGADMDKVIISDTMTTEKGEKSFGLDVDLPSLREALESNPNIKLIVIDPIMNHLGSLKGNAEQELRAALTPLGKLAEKFGVAVVLVTHFNKSIGSESIQRVGGAMGMVGAVRIAWTFTEDKDDGNRKMLPLKANLSPDTGGLVYKIVPTIVEVNGQNVDIGKIEFGNVSHSSVDASLKNDAKNGVSKLDEAKVWLAEFLSDGTPKQVDEIYPAGDSMGFGKSTLLNAAIKLGCKKLDGDPGGAMPTWQLVKME
jgi:putative DNA primase/helicase